MNENAVLAALDALRAAVVAPNNNVVPFPTPPAANKFERMANDLDKVFGLLEEAFGIVEDLTYELNGLADTFDC